MSDAAASSSGLVYKRIGIQGHSVGVVKFTDEAAVWSSGDSTQKIMWSKVEKAGWAIFGKYCHMRLYMKDSKDAPARLDGFQKTDFDALKEALGKVGVKLSREKVNCGGGNYGEFTIEGGLLNFFHGDKKSFDISLKQISQCVLPGNKKGNNDVELQLHESDAMDATNEDCLVEMRLYLPDPSDEEDEGQGAGAQANGTHKPRGDHFTAESFQAAIMDRANIRDVKGSVLCEIDINLGTFLTPRGRYALEMYSTFLRMHGSKYDYKIQYEDINKLVLLEKPDDRYYAFVISLDKPVRQGQQRYQHLVLQATKVEETLQMNMSDAELAQEKYSGALQHVMSGPLFRLIATVFKALSGRSVFTSGNYRSASGAKCVKCAVGASEGHLYPLNKSFIFIHKPTRIIGFDEVECVEFLRYGGAQDASSVRRSFDLCITLKSIGGENQKDYIFSGIDRPEYPKLYEWCQQKTLRIKNIKSSGTTAPSALTEALAADAREEGEIQRAAVEDHGDGEDSEGSEEDADYQPPSQSDDDPGASDHEDGASDGEGGSAKPSKPKPKDKPSKKKAKPDTDSEGEGGGSGSDGDGGSDAGKPKKAKAKAKGEGKRKAGDKDGDKPAKKKRRKKDPNAPKGAKSAFMYFSSEQRTQVLKDQPSLKVTEVSKILGERWRGMTADDKKKYDDMAATDKARWKSQMDDYKATQAGPAGASAKEEKEEPNSDDDGAAGGGSGSDSE